MNGLRVAVNRTEPSHAGSEGGGEASGNFAHLFVWQIAALFQAYKDVAGLAAPPAVVGFHQSLRIECHIIAEPVTE